MLYRICCAAVLSHIAEALIPTVAMRDQVGAAALS